MISSIIVVVVVTVIIVVSVKAGERSRIRCLAFNNDFNTLSQMNNTSSTEMWCLFNGNCLPPQHGLDRPATGANTYLMIHGASLSEGELLLEWDNTCERLKHTRTKNNRTLGANPSQQANTRTCTHSHTHAHTGPLGPSLSLASDYSATTRFLSIITRNCESLYRVINDYYWFYRSLTET